jgi:hypothetical protein
MHAYCIYWVYSRVSGLSARITVEKIVIIWESCIKKEEKITIIFSIICPKNEFICLILVSNEADKSKMRQKNPTLS